MNPYTLFAILNLAFFFLFAWSKLPFLFHLMRHNITEHKHCCRYAVVRKKRACFHDLHELNVVSHISTRTKGNIDVQSWKRSIPWGVLWESVCSGSVCLGPIISSMTDTWATYLSPVLLSSITSPLSFTFLLLRKEKFWNEHLPSSDPITR